MLDIKCIQNFIFVTLFFSITLFVTRAYSISQILHPSVGCMGRSKIDLSFKEFETETVIASPVKFGDQIAHLASTLY